MTWLAETVGWRRYYVWLVVVGLPLILTLNSIR
jgi:predicted MFS family arabinose efflux permease